MGGDISYAFYYTIRDLNHFLQSIKENKHRNPFLKQPEKVNNQINRYKNISFYSEK